MASKRVVSRRGFLKAAAAAVAAPTVVPGSALGLFRLGVVAELEGRPAKAAARWLDLLESKTADERMLAAAKFMLGRAGSDVFSESRKTAAASGIDSACADLLIALRIAGTGDAEQLQRREHVDSSRELALKARRWPYHVFAAGLLGP